MRKLFLILMTVIGFTLAVSAQTRTYHGTVIDAANNEPLIGATIVPIGGGQGTAADIDGKFTLTVPENVTQAKITYVGYQDQVVKLQDNMTIRLTATSANLDDVVVVAYGTANKESLTGSVAVVGSQEIEDRPVTSVTAALEGNAPGVQVNNSTGYPGSQPSIRIRGFNSINGVNTPLYVVDGMIYEGDIADLNPADIESMSVLKDAASCALYGNRGANGVILINTKRAKKTGKVDVTLQIRQGMYQRGLPYYDRLDIKDWMETQLMGWTNGMVSSGAYNTYEEALSNSRVGFVSGPLRGSNIFDKEAAELFTADGKLNANVLPGYNDLDWWDAISQNGHRQEYNINAAGASEKFNIFASAGYLKENGYLLHTDFERFNGRLNATFQPVSYLKFGVNLAASHVNSEVGEADSDNLNLVTNPFLTMFNAPVKPYYLHDKNGNIVEENGEKVWNTTGLNRGDNIAWTMRLNRNQYNSNNIDGTIFGTAILPYGFELTLKGQIYRSSRTKMSYSNNLVGSQKGKGGLDEQFTNYNSHTFQQQLNWSHEYGRNHIDVLLDHENYQYGYRYSFIRKSGQLLPGMLSLSNFQSEDFDSEVANQMRSESYLGRVRYNFDQQYFLEASIRRDGTSRFEKDNRWGTFWSVGGSWIITKEKFMQNINWLNYLKLRTAYGSVGNDASAGWYSYWSLYGFGTMDGATNLVPSQLAGQNVKWEATKTFDIALEGSILNDRLNFSVGYFNKRNSDLLFNVTRPLSSGNVDNNGINPKVLMNVGTMQNIGWELAFGVDIIRNRDLKWNLNIDATFMKNKIIKLPDGKDMIGQALFQGKSIYEHYRTKWVGIDQLTGQSLYEMNPSSPDYIAYKDDNTPYFDEAKWQKDLADAERTGHLYEKDGVYYTDRPQYARRQILGSALPTVYGSFGTNLSWKGLNLSLLFTYSLGGKTYNSNYASLMNGISSDSPQALHKDILNSWTSAPAGITREINVNGLPVPVIDPDGVPVINSDLQQYNNYSSSRWLISSNYLSLKNINLSYDLPSSWVGAMKLQNINLGVSIDNLFLVTRQKGLNPQYGFGGGQGAYYMPSRVFSFQLSAKF
ncbi:MAG: SusC/RagA family TonB-linked outer membrane protein [Muribaculaceae bacterium]|nr:SusC/RagA family TonB-linked outer membrane protein [Muribaculaceae bacterium]